VSHWFIKSIYCKRIKFKKRIYLFNVGISYTPLESTDKKTLFRFGIIKFSETFNHFRIKFLLFDFSMTYCTNKLLRLDSK